MICIPLPFKIEIGEFWKYRFDLDSERALFIYIMNCILFIIESNTITSPESKPIEFRNEGILINSISKFEMELNY